MSPETANLISITVNDGFENQTWQVFDKIEPWSRTNWSIPTFGITLEALDVKWGELRFYTEEDIANERIFSSKERVLQEDALKYPEDGFAGSKFIAIRLARILNHGLSNYGNVPMEKSSDGLAG